MKSRTTMLRKPAVRVSAGLLLLAGLCLALGVSARPAHAATTLTVSNCSNDSQLQADVSQANSDNAGDTITFSCSGDIPLSSTLTITGSMTIDGSGQSVTLDGHNQVQVLSVNIGPVNNVVIFTLNYLTVANGLAPTNSAYAGGGGLINNGGTVNINGSTFTNNSAPNGSGAIWNTFGVISNGGALWHDNHRLQHLYQ